MATTDRRSCREEEKRKKTVNVQKEDLHNLWWYLFDSTKLGILHSIHSPFYLNFPRKLFVNSKADSKVLPK